MLLIPAGTKHGGFTRNGVWVSIKPEGFERILEPSDAKAPKNGSKLEYTPKENGYGLSVTYFPPHDTRHMHEPLNGLEIIVETGLNSINLFRSKQNDQSPKAKFMSFDFSAKPKMQKNP